MCQLLLTECVEAPRILKDSSRSAILERPRWLKNVLGRHLPQNLPRQTLRLLPLGKRPIERLQPFITQCSQASMRASTWEHRA
jgi:hypothetical protein